MSASICINWKAVRSETGQALAFIAAYMISFFVYRAFSPVASMKLADVPYDVVFFYFPYCVLALGVWLLDWRVVPYMTFIILFWYAPFRPEMASLIIAIKTLNALVASRMLKRFVHHGIVSVGNHKWVEVVSIGFIGSGLNLLAANAIFSFSGLSDRLWSSFAMVTGQISGLILGLIILAYSFRIARRLSPVRIVRS